jgi:microcystin-dependent protein
MADTTTSNFGWVKAEIGSSQDTWGAKNNANLDDIDAVMREAMPVGASVDFWGTVAPLNWLFCDGSVHNIADYPKLGALLGSRFGGDGVLTFATPPVVNGRGTIGADATYALGSTGGAATVTLDATMMPAHVHGVNDPTHAHGVNDGGHNHNVNDPTHNHPQSPHAHGASQDAHNHTVTNTISNPPGGLSNGGAAFGLTVTTTSSAQPNVYVTAANANIGAAASGVFLSASGANVSVAAAGTGVSLQSAGGGAAHNNMPPYIACNKIIKAA